MIILLEGHVNLQEIVHARPQMQSDSHMKSCHFIGDIDIQDGYSKVAEGRVR